MAHQAIYRKWRPAVFEDVVGQGHITRTLKNQIMSGKIGHAYLFCGTRGTGKTTCAKIFSRAVNCLNNKDGSPCNECSICRGILDGSILDVTEIDAASNNGVDNIREIRDDVRYVASEAKYTVYIIDEVHMLSGGAFNALLKTLEEPPEHVIFILATTEPQKVPQTILSRCQRFDFKRIKPSDIIARMKEIAYGDGYDISDGAYTLLARLADGSMRDALSILERVVSSCGNKITSESITDTLGISTLDSIYAITDSIINGNADGILSAVAEILSDGKDLKTFIGSLIKYFRDLMVLKISQNSSDALDYSAEELVKVKSQCSRLTFEKISHAVSVLTDAHVEAKYVKSPRVIYELALIKLARPETDTSPAALADRVASLEQKISEGAPPAAAAVTAAQPAPAISPQAEVSIERRLDALEKKLENAELKAKSDTGADEESKKPAAPKKAAPKRLYSPIPADELNSENPIVKLAKNWNNTLNFILNAMPHLMAALMNRDITIDADGIILLYKKSETLSKNLAVRYMDDIKKLFTKATGAVCDIKAVTADDIGEENIIDFWTLPAPAAAEEPSADAPKKGEDPLDRLAKNFPEVVELTDDREFLEYGSEGESFSQSEIDEEEDEPEEFLEDHELRDEDEE